MTTSRDLLGVVEAAYELRARDEDWLVSLLGEMKPLLDVGLGVAGFFFDARDPDALRFTTPRVLGAPTATSLAFGAALRLLPARMVRQAFGGTTAMASASQVFGLGQKLDEHFLVKHFGHPFGFHDMIGFKVRDPSGAGLLVVAALPEIREVSRREREPWEMCAAHVAAALRLRRTLTSDSFTGAEAVLEPDGSVAHAEGSATSRDARAVLREAVLATERARGPLRKTDPTEALELWQALVAGRWSLVEQFDSDGHRYLVARRNAPKVRDPRGLSPRESQVVAYAALGHSTKLIGYELGVAPSTIAKHLTSAMTKLRVSTRGELMQLMGARTA